MQERTSCARCGADLSPGSSLSGLCASCLLQLGLAPESTASTVAPPLGATHQSLRPPAHLHFAPRAAIPALGGRFGPYHLTRELGRGGFGIVWEAEHLETGRRVALKVVTEVRAGSPQALERFEREGRLAASVNHPHCVFVFGAEEIDGYPVISMELMAGGTLQDEINRRGRIPAKQAVDYILNVIDGLNVAHEAGVIHRDVKPSNCFLDEHGAVKIGDFGISKTLEGDVQLTLSGSFVGTPVYASPEQARGREVDFRSDMFSVGATLYALVTGKPPFSGTNAADVLARVLTEDPPAVAPQGVELPRGLERVVRRAMAKDPNRRYRDYESLRAALLPFSSHGLTPAGVAQRLAAYLADAVLVMPVVMAFAWSVGLWAMESVPGAILLYVLSPASFYFALTEGLWGRSLGKRLFDLYVTTTAGSAASMRQVIVRVLVLQMMAAAGAIAQTQVALRGWPAAFQLLGFAGPLLVMVTMRARNGYAGLHELLSGTRVVATRTREPISVPEARLSVAGQEGHATRWFGPYRHISDLWVDIDEALLLAYDDLLKRTVWVHSMANPERAVPLGSQDADRPGRLRWLAGSRRSGDCWDAYQAPSGTSMRDWVAWRGRLSWNEMRQVLVGLAAELEKTPIERPLSIDHVWIDAYGESKLLDFPAARRVPKILIDDSERFLHHVSLFGLDGRLVPADQLDEKVPEVPLPEHVREAFEEIADVGRRDARRPRWFVRLQAIVERPAAVTRARRLGPLMAVAGPAALGAFFAMMLFVVPVVLERTDLGELMRYSAELRRLERMAQRGERVPPDQLEAIRKLVAANYKKTGTTPWFRQIGRDEVPAMDALLARYPAVSDAEIVEARALLQQTRPSGPPPIPYPTLRQRLGMTRTVALFPLAVLAIPAIVFALVLRGGLMFRLSGIALQTAAGRPADRARCLSRALLVWAPFLAFCPLFGLNPIARFVPVSVVALAAGVSISGLVYALIKPARGLPDLLVGTHLVPK